MILAGRSALTPEKQRQLDSLRSLGVKVDYQSVDVCDRASVDALFERIARAHAPLTSIVHCAGVVTPHVVIGEKTSQEELPFVLGPKVAGLMHLDEASRDLTLDCFVCFSSVASALGQHGLADYSAANGFMDAYAHYRNELVRQGRRHGMTLAVNWPLWAEGGMQADAGVVEQMRHSGVRPLSTAMGLAALERSLNAGCSQVVVISGTRSKAEPSAADRTPEPVRASGMDGDLLQKVTRTLLLQVSSFLKVRAEDVDPDRELSEHGLDSIGLTELANQLNKRFDLRLTPTLFFEHTTLARVARYLTQVHGAQLARALGVHSEKSAQPRQAREPASTSDRPVFRPVETTRPRDHERGASDDPVAIIGMSGRFPGAPDIDTFWTNLQEGKDCITEVPALRWDWRAVYGDPAREPNKTNIKWGGFIDGVDEFDPMFFGISPAEALQMDPQQRLLITHAWQAIEDAGYSTQSLYGSRTAIFVGTGASGYGELVAQAGAAIEGHSATSGVLSSVGPNRVSFLLGLHGPSEPIETACSSSLVAIHRAVRAIQAGDCDMALVGGIQTIITPWAHISFGKAGMLCEDGRCKTFSRDANGYVRGEGAGMLFLKRLSAAQRDGDCIHAIIRGSAENHGGRASSLTAPNPKAQAELLKTAYREAKIDPRTVTYIETHGTGTPLGDPIEIDGLKSAFADLYADDGIATVAEPHCGLGSVKTNIGHLELAAGIASVMKVLLQLKHRTLVKTLHCAELNPYIQLQGSPFYIVRENQPWVAARDASGRTLPRRAGVSSFGFGGVNAHVILEEYQEPEALTRADAGVSGRPVLIVLSAKTQERLQVVAQQLRAHLDKNSCEDSRLVDLAYTLQIGRDAFEHRLAFPASTMAEVQEKLTSYVEGRAAEECYVGQVKREKETLSLLSADEELQEAVSKWVRRGKYGKLLELWVKGLSYDWQQLYREDAPYADVKPRRMRLPTYPFARERYWVEVPKAVARSGAVEVLHPLVHRNTSRLEEQRFSTQLSGEAFYLSDHVINGQRILPGVAYLEMARAAVLQSLGEEEASGVSVELRDVVWLRPVVVESEREVHLGLYPEEDGSIGFEVYTQEAGAEEVVHAQGRAVLVRAEDEQERLGERIDVAGLRGRSEQSFAASQCYEAFEAIGIRYGLAHQGLKGVWTGRDERGEPYVLGEVELPGCVSDTQGQYELHPSVLDAALQVSIGLGLRQVGEGEVRGEALVPFALERLQVVRGIPRAGYVLVRGVESTGSVQKLDVQLCDEVGEVCVRLRGYSARVLQPETARPTTQPLLLQPVWEPKPLGAGSERNASEQSVSGENTSKQGTGEQGTPPARRVWVDAAYREHLPELQRRAGGLTWSVLATHATADGAKAATARRATADEAQAAQPAVTTPVATTGAADAAPGAHTLAAVAAATGATTTALPSEGAAVLAVAEQLFTEVQQLVQAKPAGEVLLQVVLSEGSVLASVLSGLLKSAQQENPNLKGQLIELPADAGQEQLLQAVQAAARTSRSVTAPECAKWCS
jgi:polyketide synthase PksN